MPIQIFLKRRSKDKIKWKYIFWNCPKLFGPDQRILIRKTNCFSFLADVLLEDSLKKSDNILDIFNYITRCTLDIILETAMGQAMGIQLARESTYVLG